MKTIFALLFICSVHVFWAQEGGEQGIEVRQKIGFLAAHHGTMAHLPVSGAKAVEVTYYFHTSGSKKWHKAYNYPTIGGTLFFGSVGNNELLGRFSGLYGFAELPMLKVKKFEWNFKLGCGVGYAGKTFDGTLNPKENAISSHINAQICVGTKAIYRFEKNAVALGLDITHFSNASFKVPNYGINLPYLSLGYARTLITTKPTNTDVSSVPLKRFLFGGQAIISAKQLLLVGGKRYPVYGLYAYSRYFFSQKAGIELGLDAISKQILMSYEPLVRKTQGSIIQLGIYAGYLVPFDHFHFVFGMGAYIRDVYKTDAPVYNRIGFRYQFTNGLQANFTLKTHFARADYFEVGLGYTFNYKQDEK